MEGNERGKLHIHDIHEKIGEGESLSSCKHTLAAAATAVGSGHLQ
jgi:hypothetical protein